MIEGIILNELLKVVAMINIEWELKSIVLAPGSIEINIMEIIQLYIEFEATIISKHIMVIIIRKYIKVELLKWNNTLEAIAVLGLLTSWVVEPFKFFVI